MNLPKVLKLDLSRWICGSPFTGNCKPDNFLGHGMTQLLNSCGYMCCLGQFCEQAGVDRQDLLGVSTPIRGVSTKELFDNDVVTDLASKAMHINDNRVTTVKEKIRLLKMLFEKNGFTIEVVGDIR